MSSMSGLSRLSEDTESARSPSREPEHSHLGLSSLYDSQSPARRTSIDLQSRAERRTRRDTQGKTCPRTDTGVTELDGDQQLGRTYAETRRGAAVGVRFMFARHVAVAALTVLGSTYLIRRIGPELWGAYSVAYVLLVSADALLSRGIIAGLLRRDVPADSQMVDSAARIVLYAGFFIATILSAVPFVVAPWYEPTGFRILMFATAGGAACYALRSLPLVLLERNLRYRRVALAEAGETATFYAVAIPASYVLPGFGALAIGILARTSASFFLVRRSLRAPLLGRVTGSAAQVLLPFGTALSIQHLIAASHGLVGFVALIRYPTELGYFAAAVTVVGYGLSVAVASQRVAVPTLSHLHGQQLAHATQRAAVLTGFLTLCFTIPVGSLAAIWLEPLFGSAWREAASFFEVTAVALSALGFSAVLASAVTAIGQTKHLVAIESVTTALYFGLAILLVGAWDPLGCAVALAVANWLRLVLYLGSIRRLTGVWVYEGILLLLATGTMAYALLLAARDLPPSLITLTVMLVGAGWLGIHRRHLSRVLAFMREGLLSNRRVAA
jgi:O-antigen/teichoic acid export membrane protein